MVVNGVTHIEKEPVGKALLEACKGMTDKNDKPIGNISRINNTLDDLPKRLDGLKSQLQNYNKQMEAAKTELAQPFPHEAELAEKEQRLALLNADLNIDGDGGMDVMNGVENREESGEEHPINDDISDDCDEPEECGEPLPRTGTYGKSAPSFLKNIKNLGNRKQDAPVTGGKSKEAEL